MSLYIILLNIKHLTLNLNIKNDSTETCSPHHLPLRGVCSKRDSQHGFCHIMRLAEASKSTGLGKWLGGGNDLGTWEAQVFPWTKLIVGKMLNGWNGWRLPCGNLKARQRGLEVFFFYCVLMLWNPNCLLIRLLWSCFRRENLAIYTISTVIVNNQFLWKGPKSHSRLLRAGRNLGSWQRSSPESVT